MSGLFLTISLQIEEEYIVSWPGNRRVGDGEGYERNEVAITGDVLTGC